MQIWIPAVVGGMVFACVGALASRLVVAVAVALTLGIAASLATMPLAQIGGSGDDQLTQDQITDPEGLTGPIPDIPLPEAVAEWLDRIDPGLGNQDTPEAQPERALPDLPLDLPLDLASESLGESLEIPEQAQRYVDHIQHIAGQLVDALKAKWETTPESSRPTVIASALSGLLVGMLLGALARGLSAAVVTASSGSLLWLSCGRPPCRHDEASVQNHPQDPMRKLCRAHVELCPNSTRIECQRPFKPKSTQQAQEIAMQCSDQQPNGLTQPNLLSLPARSRHYLGNVG